MGHGLGWKDGVPLLAIVAAMLWAGVPATWAACAAAPTGSTQDTVIQMKASGGSAGIGPVANLAATGEGALVYDSSADQLKLCDGTNWNVMGPTTLGPIASTSGTNVDFTGIPAWVTHIKVMTVGVSTNSSGAPRFQLGSSAGFVATGYSGSAFASSGSATGTSSLSNGFLITASGSSAHTRNGVIEFWQLNAATNLWVASGQWGFGNTDRLSTVAGTVTLPGTLDRVRLYGDGDTYDAGSVYLTYD